MGVVGAPTGTNRFGKACLGTVGGAGMGGVGEEGVGGTKMQSYVLQNEGGGVVWGT